MRRRHTLAFAVLFVLVVLWGGVALAQTPQAALERCDIYRDEYGVPHIFGPDGEAVFTAQGYVQAQDHLVPMLRVYMGVLGRLAEVDGPSGLETDQLIRLFRVPQVAEETWDEQAPEVKTICSSFTQGINLYMGEHPEQVPSWWTGEVQPWHIIAREKAVTWAVWMRQLGLAPGVLGFSNQLAVAPSRSASGGAIISMDPHLPWDDQFRWYEVHFCVRGKYNLAGATLYGIPGIVMGHNQYLAWCMTFNNTDLADTYEEPVNPSNPTQYQYDGAWRTFVTATHTFKVREGESLTEVAKTFKYTHRGPVIKEEAGKVISARVSGYEVYDAALEVYRMGTATNLDEFKAALRMLSLPLWNIMYIDQAGNIYYLHNSRSFSRPQGYDWTKPVPGWTSATEWGPLVPLEQLPQVENPKSGWLQNCNVAPWLVTVDPGIKQEQFPSWIAAGGVNNRGQRASDLLSSDDHVTAEKMMSYTTDTLLPAASQIVPVAIAAHDLTKASISDPTGRLAQAVDLLRAWDFRATVDSPATTLFMATAFLLAQEQKEVTNPTAILGEVVNALNRAVGELEKNFGTFKVPWGQVHFLEREGKRFPLPGGVGGPLESLRIAWGFPNEKWEVRCVGGSSFQMVVDFGPPLRAFTMLPFGESDDPSSPHFADLAPLYSAGKYKPAWFTEEEVKSHSTLWVLICRAGALSPARSFSYRATCSSAVESLANAASVCTRPQASSRATPSGAA